MRLRKSQRSKFWILVIFNVFCFIFLTATVILGNGIQMFIN